MTESVPQIAEQVGVLGSLGIDWKLFLAQLVNFGIVLVVLWKWAYTPLLKVLDERKKTIAESLENAKAIDARMKRVGAEEGAMMKAAHERATEVLTEAELSAKDLRKAETEKTQTHVETMLAGGKAELAELKSHVIVEAKKDLASIVVAAVEKIVGETDTDKAHAELVKKAQKALETV